MNNTPNAVDLLDKALGTFKERNAVYGNCYNQNGEVMKALFPNGMPIPKTELDYNRLINFNLIVTKLVRYCQHFDNPHIDSIHDQGVYCFIQEELDHAFLKKQGDDIPFDAVKCIGKPVYNSPPKYERPKPPNFIKE